MNNRATTFKVQGEDAGISYRCPGCGSLHSVYTAARFRSKPGFHEWNGKLDEPTLAGTVYAYWTGCNEPTCDTPSCEEPAHQRRQICRHTLRKGMVTYTENSTGRQRSDTVPLENEF